MTHGRSILPTYRPGRFVIVWLFLLTLPGGHVLALDRALAAPPQPTGMPGEDRLAVPVLPESPTQVESGQYLYYFHCMPCHGDRGQGLTDEWRQVWVEDHRNCWGRNCHAGRSEMDAFYIPRVVPPVSGSPQALGSFQAPEDLFVFLQQTQPPQRPGALSEEEYWALTAFLLDQNDRLPSEAQGPAGLGHSISTSDLVLATLVPLLALSLVLWPGKATGKGRSGEEPQVSRPGGA
jgi:mono/diheme cytochrome c family protein